MTPAPDFSGDIDLRLAIAAHAGTSRTPTRMGRDEVASYAATLTADWRELSAMAKTADLREILDREFSVYRAGYRVRTIAYLMGRARCVTAAIAAGPRGGSPKRVTVSPEVTLRSRERAGYRVLVLDSIRTALRVDGPRGSSAEIDGLRRRVGEAEARHAVMRGANVLLRWSPSSEDAAYARALERAGVAEGAGAVAILRSDQAPSGLAAALASIGVPPVEVAQIILQEAAGDREGYSETALKNSLGRLLHLRRRLRAAENEQDARRVAGAVEIVGRLGRVVEIPSSRTVRFHPEASLQRTVRDRLHGAGFAWASTTASWDAALTPQSAAAVREIAEVG